MKEGAPKPLKQEPRFYQRTPENREHFIHREDLRVGDALIDFYKVIHNHETYSAYQEYINDAVVDSDVVILEATLFDDTHTEAIDDVKSRMFGADKSGTINEGYTKEVENSLNQRISELKNGILRKDKDGENYYLTGQERQKYLQMKVSKNRENLERLLAGHYGEFAPKDISGLTYDEYAKDQLNTDRITNKESAGSFFGPIDEFASRNGKPTIMLDPYDVLSTHLDVYLDQEKTIDQEIANNSDVAIAAAAFLAGAGIQNELLSKEKSFTRRSVLFGGAAAAATAAAGLNSSQKANKKHDHALRHGSVRSVSEYETLGIGRNPEDSDSLYLQRFLDYRDVVIAEHLLQIQDQLKDKKVAMFYGAAHLLPIKHYLNNPAERKAKLELYKKYFFKTAPPTRKVRTPLPQKKNAWDIEETTLPD